MAHTLPARDSDCQTASDDQCQSAESVSTDLTRWLGFLKQAMQETGWTPDALDAHWRVSRGYAWRLVAGERPWSVERMLSLPDDLEARLHAIEAEAFGHMVVPQVDEQEARRCLAIGIFSLFGALPEKTSGPIKAALRTDRKERLA